MYLSLGGTITWSYAVLKGGRGEKGRKCVPTAEELGMMLAEEYMCVPLCTPQYLCPCWCSTATAAELSS